MVVAAEEGEEEVSVQCGPDAITGLNAEISRLRIVIKVQQELLLEAAKTMEEWEVLCGEMHPNLVKTRAHILTMAWRAKRG